MLRSLSALACLTIFLGLAGVAAAQCPPATIGVYFDEAGTVQAVAPVQHQFLELYVILFAEAPVGGAAWQLDMTSPQFPGELVGPPGPQCQPPWCQYQDPPFWYLGADIVGPVVLGNPFDGGVRQGLGTCYSGFFGNPVLLATITLMPWADVLGTIEVDVTVIPDVREGLVFVDCSARPCRDTVVGLTSRLEATVVPTENLSWGAVKATYQ